ncbi:MAG: site-specific DNA-methyltransferase [Candidatus Binatia bacterium]
MARNNRKENQVNQTGLYWPGKRTEVERVILPFQIVETVNESKADRDELTLFRQRGEPAPGWRNKLIWGDNKYIMASLLPEFAGKVNLIYIDPPFATGADFSINIKLGDLEWTKEASVIEEKAYRDTWGRGLDSYLQMMYDRLVLMRELLADNGSIYVHCDWHVGHYLKMIMDEIFGKENFRNEVVWGYKTGGVSSTDFAVKHDVLLKYSKSNSVIHNDVPQKSYNRTLPEPHTKSGRRLGVGRDDMGKFRMVIRRDWWDDVETLFRNDVERVGFPTQKPESLLDVVIRSSSNEGDLVADFFCGSGTTGAVAEKLGRRWIMSDLSKFAIHTARKRLLDIKECHPFEVLNLGKYQKAKLKENGITRYIDFVLKLYRAEPLSGYSTIHGRKAGRMVHIGDVDSIVTEREIRETVKECASAGAKAVDFLGWDFEMGLHDLVDRIGDQHSVKIHLVQIPKEALEVRDAAREEVKFFDLNYLELEHRLKSKALGITLKDFVISNPEYLPEDVREKVKKFTDYIDYWAVDFNYKEDTFHNMWQSFRTRKHPALETKCSHTYEEPGKYQVLVKVVDIFGNDTNKLIEVEVS